MLFLFFPILDIWHIFTFCNSSHPLALHAYIFIVQYFLKCFVCVLINDYPSVIFNNQFLWNQTKKLQLELILMCLTKNGAKTVFYLSSSFSILCQQWINYDKML